MAILDRSAKIVHYKIAYYGLGMAGKTTNLQALHQRIPVDLRSDLMSIATETERTLFFNFTPADIPSINGFAIRFHLYAVPGCVLYERTRIAILQGADGVVFVADSQRDRIHESIKSLQEMVRGLYRLGKSLEHVPVVLQYNKRDMPSILPVAVLDKYLNPLQWPRFESSFWWGDSGDRWQAKRIVGVLETFHAIQQLVLDHANRR